MAGPVLPFPDNPDEVASVSAQAFRLAKNDPGYLYGYAGPLQRHIFCFMLLVVFVSSLQTMVVSKFLPEIEHWCATPAHSNLTEEQWRNTTGTTYPGGSRSECTTTTENGAEVHCAFWVYQKKPSTRTLTDEFNLVCHRKWLKSVISAIFFVGCLTSDPIVGNAADAYGRHIVVFLGVLIVVAAGFILLVVRDFANFLLCRFVIAFGIEGAYSAGTVLLSEVADAKDRTLVMVAVFVSWSFGYLFLWIVATFLDNWIFIQGTIMIPTVLLCVGLHSLIESPRWLLAIGSLDYLELVILFAAKKNAVDMEVSRDKWTLVVGHLKKPPISTYIPKKLRVREPPPDSDGYLTLLAHQANHKMLKTVIVLCFSWTVNVFMFYALWLQTISATKSSTFFTSDLCSFIGEVGSFFLTGLTINRFGRKWSSAATMFISGVLALPVLLLQEDGSFLYVPVAVTCTMCIASANRILRIHTLEIFPTVVRSRGFHCCSFFGRFGAMLASFSDNTAITEATAAGLYLVFSSLCLLDSALLLWLPETMGRNLPDDFSDIEDILGPFAAAPIPLTPPALRVIETVDTLEGPFTDIPDTTCVKKAGRDCSVSRGSKDSKLSRTSKGSRRSDDTAPRKSRKKRKKRAATSDNVPPHIVR